MGRSAGSALVTHTTMVAYRCYNDKMADDLKEIQIEVRWKRVVRQEAERKQNAYPWNLPLSPCKLRAVSTKRSDSTEAESNRSESPEHLSRVQVFSRPPALPRPLRRSELPTHNKENINPDWHEGHKSTGPLLTFRKRESLPLLGELPLQETPKPDAYEQLLGLSPRLHFDEDELASTSGFVPKVCPDLVNSPDSEISITLDHFLDGVNQLKGDLRALQVAASASKSTNSFL